MFDIEKEIENRAKEALEQIRWFESLSITEFTADELNELLPIPQTQEYFEFFGTKQNRAEYWKKVEKSVEDDRRKKIIWEEFRDDIKRIVFEPVHKAFLDYCMDDRIATIIATATTQDCADYVLEEIAAFSQNPNNWLMEIYKKGIFPFDFQEIEFYEKTEPKIFERFFYHAASRINNKPVALCFYNDENVVTRYHRWDQSCDEFTPIERKIRIRKIEVI
jgi:hypothetical protein